MNRTPTASHRVNAPAAALWASAFVIAALIILQAGRLPTNPAYGAVTADRGSYTLMTGNSGRGGEVRPNELLYVIDSREQMFMVYEIEDARKKQIILRDGYSLDALFQRAKQ